MRITHAARAITVAAATMLLAGILAGTAMGDGTRITRGAFAAFAAGTTTYAGVEGRAQMLRTAQGKTIVTVHVTGLLPDTAYGSHVHAARCESTDANGNPTYAGGHYKHDPAGPPTPPNELWPAFTTSGDGVGNGKDTASWTAGPSAVSVVIHAPGGAKIACANLL